MTSFYLVVVMALFVTGRSNIHQTARTSGGQARSEALQLRSIDLRSADTVGPDRCCQTDTNVKNNEDTNQDIQMHEMHCMVADGENDIWMVHRNKTRNRS